MEQTTTNDSSLIEEFQRGHSRSFDLLIDRYRAIIYAILITKVKDPDLADDLTQEVVIKIFDKLSGDSYKEANNFKGWLIRVVHNHCLDYFRKVKRSVKIVLINEGDDEHKLADAFVPSIETTLIKEQMIVDVRGMIEKLPPEQREIIILREYANKSYKEISNMTGEKINTSTGRMRYALNNLRKMLKHG